MRILQIVLTGLMLMGASVAWAERPNIIFLMADDQNTYSMGCYGNEDVQTPHLDLLSDQGITFDRHYDTTSICMASRANVMMGMYEYKTGCNFGHGPVMAEMWEQSYPIVLRAAGYRTAFAGKFGFLLRESPEDANLPLPADDFDWWAGAKGQSSYTTSDNPGLSAYTKDYPHATLAYGAFGSDFIRHSATNTGPFCLSISFKSPHKPAKPDSRFDDVYAGKVFQKPANYGREKGAHFSKQSQAGRQYTRFEDWHYDDDYDNVMASYNQQVYGIDQAVGMIRSALEEAGVADNTIIIYTSDNGFLCGSHGYGSKVLPYEEASRVPLIVYDPRHANSNKKLRSKALTGNIDFAPTILNLAGLPVPENMDGKSLLPLYENPALESHEALSLINVWGPEPAHALAVLANDFKYIYWGYVGTNGYEITEELYHLGDDPLELVNRAVDPAHADELEAMRLVYDKQLAHWKAETVPYNDYHKYATLFDRHIDWETRENGPYPLTVIQPKLNRTKDALISFNTNLDREYQVYMRTNLVSGSWMPLGERIVSDGTPERVEDENDFPGAYYYIEEIDPAGTLNPADAIPVEAVRQSTEKSSTPSAGNAIDGDLESFSHTDNVIDPNNDAYWEMTFDGDYALERIELVNRNLNKPSVRLNNCKVWIYNSVNTIVWTSEPISGASGGSVHSFSIPAGQIGNRVRIGLLAGELNGKDDTVISLAEVKAWGRAQ